MPFKLKISAAIPLALTWGACVAAGFFFLLVRQMTPGSASGASAPRWPVAATRPVQRFILVMAVHPQCACSKASLTELAEILSRAIEPVDVQILFVVPKGSPADWLESSTLTQARTIPGVHTVIDQQGTRAQLLGASTSGEVFVYQPDGKLCFHGGITDGRGHQGENLGRTCVLAILRGQVPATAFTPVYGCELGLQTFTSLPGRIQ